MGSINERWCYNVTSSLIGWAHNQNDPWCLTRLSLITHVYLRNMLAMSCTLGIMTVILTHKAQGLFLQNKSYALIVLNLERTILPVGHNGYWVSIVVADDLLPQHLGIGSHSADICICFQQFTVVNGLKTKFTEVCFHEIYIHIYILRNQHTTTDCLGFNWKSNNIGTGNGLVSSGTRTLPDPILIRSRYVTLCDVTRQQGVNEDYIFKQNRAFMTRWLILVTPLFLWLNILKGNHILLKPVQTGFNCTYFLSGPPFTNMV